MIYAVLSDIHAHAWSLFSHANSDGVNSRLRIILDEIKRAVVELKRQGGKTLVISGDILHTRGVIDPEVLNPLREVFEWILAQGIEIVAIPGNHDLKSKDSQALSSAIENLVQISLEGTQFRVFNEVSAEVIDGEQFGFVPWRWTQEALLEDLEKLSKHPNAKIMDVFIHAGIDGVISGMPAGGLTDAKLAAFGFRRVFAGHYHNHKPFPGGVYSIGATTHHNWGDVGTRAGFLIVDTAASTVAFHDTMAPKFVDLSGLDEFEMELEAKNNYARFRGPPMTQDEINQFRDQLKAWGALGVSIEVPKTTVTARSATPVKGLTLEQSVEKFIGDSDPNPHVTQEAILKRSLEILNLSRTVFEEA